MKKDMVVGVSLSAVAIIVLGGWLIWQAVFPSPVAQWVFYGEKPSEARGFSYPPAKNSATGHLENKPEIPEGDGALLTQWADAKQCSLIVKSGKEKISVTRFNESNQPSVQVRYIDSHDVASELNVQINQGVSFWTYPDAKKPGEYVGWKFDNLAGKPIPIRYRGKELLEGTVYKRLTNGKWSYERFHNGKSVETKELEQLPAISSENEEHELAIVRDANQWLSHKLQKLSESLSVPVPDQWLNSGNDPCLTVNAEI
ncbi:hypothetical protein [Budvicia diplopodorum]|uniref:hypothetical protein n=1 Tax=Budvicia diplopodorum TaxID=1119056 RepID=UPI00135C8856|nr:hypothetical protein [Budvicia diplopodorum]